MNAHLDSPFQVLIAGSLSGKAQELQSALGTAEYQVFFAPALADVAPLNLEHERIAVAVLDQSLGAAKCYELLSTLKAKAPACQTILYSANPGVYDAMEATRRGAFWFLAEPFELEQLLLLVSKAAVMHELRVQNAELRSSLSAPLSTVQILGNSPSIREVLRKAEKIAPLDATVLITGESGTGKTTLAHHLHQLHSRRGGAFISVSCAAIPRDLLESELFGHEKGAFTGATATRVGAIELADGGTLFLDEIGDLPLELQPKLLTFLQDRMVKRVGGTKVKHVDVRIIAATHRNLEEMCRRKEFREDLLYRINVLTLESPPLRAHPQDIPLMAQAILDKISTKRELPPFSLTPAADSLLRGYSWPGNVRELENILERATALAEGRTLDVADFGSLRGSAPVAVTEVYSADSAPQSLVGIPLAELERRAILETLAYCHGNKAEAAKLLGVSLKTIYNKLEKLELRTTIEAQVDSGKA